MRKGRPFGRPLSVFGGDLLVQPAAVLLHGVYDTCCMSGTEQSTLVFVVFVLVMYLAVYLLIKHESKTDAPV